MLPRLHLTSDDATLARADFIEQAAAVMQCCATSIAVHVRGHATSAHDLHATAARLATLALRTGAWLFVNDRIDIAMAVRATGVQLGHRSLAIADARVLLGRGARIGYSAHGALEAGRAGAEGADFIIAGTIYDSTSHPRARGAGPTRITELARAAERPVIAIGGITVERIAAIAAAGACGVAVLSGVWAAADPAAAAMAYVAEVRRVYGGTSHDGGA